MKILFWPIFYCTFLWVGISIGDPAANAELIEQFPSGQINWTQGVVTAKGSASLSDAEAGANGKVIPVKALHQAVANIITTLRRLRVDNKRWAADLIISDADMRSRIEDMAHASKVVRVGESASGEMDVFVQMNLFGGFAQLVLPAEIRQVQPIKSLNGTSAHQDPQKIGKSSPDAYTGLIVDARGIGAKPSMVPVLVDEKGQQVFGPAYVSREFAVQHGICQYIRLIQDEWPALPRVAPRPLLVKGLRTFASESCHIVISNADASKLRGASSHLEVLKQCRVVIVLD